MYLFAQTKRRKTHVRVLFEAGKNREGYFKNTHVQDQMIVAMNILTSDYSDEDHVFIFDNATTHTKRALGALSVKAMPKFAPKTKNFLVDLVGPDGEITKGRLEGARLPDGSPQSLYWEPGHENGHPTEWWFKGTAQILFERGFKNAFAMRATCPHKCPSQSATDCCCKRALSSQPDFTEPKSALEELAESRGFSVLLLPKYHCELNPIEQCWGASKRSFRSYGIARSMPEMRTNIHKSLDSIELVQIRRYVPVAILDQ
jgi:hypothetical protein